MGIKKYEEVGRIAQEISFAFEDQYHDEIKKKMFHALFDKYLLPIDPGGRMIPYDAIISLWRKNPSEFEVMVKKMKENKLISDK